MVQADGVRPQVPPRAQPGPQGPQVREHSHNAALQRQDRRLWLRQERRRQGRHAAAQPYLLWINW